MDNERNNTLLTDNTIRFIGNPEESTKQLLAPIHEFSRVTNYKVNIEN